MLTVGRKVGIVCGDSVEVDEGVPVCLLFLEGDIVNDEKCLVT